MNNERLFAVNLLWVHDPDMFAEYQERSMPILAKHGVHVERWLMTETMEGNGFDRPDQMVVTWHRMPRPGTLSRTTRRTGKQRRFGTGR